MSAYQFAPTLNKKINHPFITWDNAFTDQEIDQIKNYAKTLQQELATIADNPNPAEESIRKSKVSWITYNQETSWIYDKLAYVGRQLNAQFYGFDLYGFLEDMQFTVYEETNESHYTWHMDISDTSPATRKLTLVMQLSDPSEYEGGELQTLTKYEPDTVEKKKGRIVGFPSFVLHKVTPVTKGTRYSLVVWICGPDFK